MMTDCVMCYTLWSGKHICTGLRRTYCNDGSHCAFYKSNVYYKRDPDTGFISHIGGVRNGSKEKDSGDIKAPGGSVKA